MAGGKLGGSPPRPAKGILKNAPSSPSPSPPPALTASAEERQRTASERQWRRARLKLEALRAFKQTIVQETQGPCSKYCMETARELVKEIEATTSAPPPAPEGVAKPREQPQPQPPPSKISGMARFRAAANAVRFQARAKRASVVRFSTASVRRFERTSSFWDHEYWDDDSEDDVFLASLSASGASLDGSLTTSTSSSFKKAKDRLVKEWESRVAMMPTEAELREACTALVMFWVKTGHLMRGRSAKWRRKFGGMDPVDVIYHRIQRHPAVALIKLASLCQRPDSFFLDCEDRQDIAMIYLFEALGTWSRQEDADTTQQQAHSPTAGRGARPAAEASSHAPLSPEGGGPGPPRKGGGGRGEDAPSGPKGRDKWRRFLHTVEAKLSELFDPLPKSKLVRPKRTPKA